MEQSFPALTEVITSITSLRARAVRDTLEPFFEHRSLVVLEDDRPKLAAVGEADLNAWRRHMSDGSSMRMRALEEGIVAELAEGRLTSAMAVARSHMEVAGLASYCCRALYDAGKRADFTPLDKLILHTYFGSSMRIQTKGTPELAQYLLDEEVRPLRVGDLIKSMDAFRAAGDTPGTRSQLTYGLLSEFAHPVMRGSKGFAQVVSEHDAGWYIRYSNEQSLDAADAEMALQILLENMRIGHAASALLNAASIVEIGGSLQLRGPTPAELRDIYVELLQQPD